MSGYQNGKGGNEKGGKETFCWVGIGGIMPNIIASTSVL